MKTRSICSGKQPLKRIEADSNRLPSGMFLINGWLSHVVVAPQLIHFCRILRKLPITILNSDTSDELQRRHKENKDSNKSS